MSGCFYQETEIAEGLRVLSHHMPQAQSVALGLFVDVGARDEAEHEAGITHALEHMVFKGAGALDVHQLAEKLDELGGNANAFTSRERTCFHLHVLYEQWQEALPLLMDMVQKPAIPEAEWKREREVIYSEMAMVDDMPEEWLADRHIEALFPKHLLGRPVLGTHESLAAIDRRQLMAYLEHWYRPPRLLITAAGRIDHDALVELIASRTWGKALPHVKRSAPEKLMHGLQALPRDMEQAQMMLSFPGIHVASDERPVAWLANQLLGGGMSSCLFREVREKRGLAYSVGSHLNALSDTGTWSISCSADTGHAVDCVEVLAAALSDFAEQVTEAELLRAQRQMEVQFRMGLDSVEGQMLYLGGRQDEARLLSPLQWVERIRAVTLAEVKQWSSARLLQPALWSIAAPEQQLAKICDKVPSC